MSLVTDFELAWKPFEDRLIAYVADNTSKNKVTELDDLISFYNSSVRMWEDPSRVQCGFLSKWKAAVPTMEEDFMGILREFVFEKPENIKTISPVFFACGTLLTSIAGGIVGYLLPKTSFLKSHLGIIPAVIIGAVVFTVFGGGIIKALYENVARRACNDIGEQYKRQVEMLHRKLQALCKQFS